jgi:hypothetical protein
MIKNFEQLSTNEIADIFDVGENTQSVITRSREFGEVLSHEPLTGDVLRRTCSLIGGEACKSVCQAPDGYPNFERKCSDMNLSSALDKILDDGEGVVMVGVTKDRVGFYDQIGDYKNEGLVSKNSQGITELPGFNAFFARASENVALGRRLADCGDVNIEFTDNEGNQVIGFMHLTRTNMQGESSFKFYVNGKKVGVFEYFLAQALEHYGAKIESVFVRVTAAITKDNYPQRFRPNEKTGQSAEEVMETRFAGWYNQGFLKNSTNPNWKPGDSIADTDKWEADYKSMVEWQIRRTGIISDNFTSEGSIDPGNLQLGHASNYAGRHGKTAEARDLYLTKVRNRKTS